MQIRLIPGAKLFQMKSIEATMHQTENLYYSAKVQMVTIAIDILIEMYIVEGVEHNSTLPKRMFHHLPP